MQFLRQTLAVTLVSVVSPSFANAQTQAATPQPPASRTSSVEAEGQARKVRTPRPSEYGLQHPFRLSIARYYVDSSDAYNDFDRRGDNEHGSVVKLDYSFFRPTRHEALWSLYVFGKAGGEDNKAAVLAMSEYRFRFGGFGKGYYGFQAGTSLGGWGAGNFLLGSSLGVDLSPSFFIETRSVGNINTGVSRGMVMLGTRF